MRTIPLLRLNHHLSRGMKTTLTEILSEHWTGFARQHRRLLCGAHYRAVRAVLSCRTPALGGRLYRCEDCSEAHFAYHSCNHRSCPQCGAYEQQIWTAKQEAKLLPMPYFMVTFTIPSQLRSLCKKYPKELYKIIIQSSAQALKDVIATKYNGGESGFTSILHTWGRKLQHHPHIHCIIPALIFKPDLTKGSLIKPVKDRFLVHYKPLARRFKSLLYSTLKDRYSDIYKNLTSAQKLSLSPAQEWNVHLQHVGKGKTAIRYLARYVCRSGFTNQRLIGYDSSGKNILLKYTPSGTKQTKILKLSIHEFIRRWLIHVLPKGFARVRHYGYTSSAAKKTQVKIWTLLGQLGPMPAILPDKEPFCCPHCEGSLKYLRDIPRPQFTRAP